MFPGSEAGESVRFGVEGEFCLASVGSPDWTAGFVPVDPDWEAGEDSTGFFLTAVVCEACPVAGAGVFVAYRALVGGGSAPGLPGGLGVIVGKR